MEVDLKGSGDGGGGGGGGGGGSGGEVRPKRKMKSAAQLEVLERTYMLETYPSESLRAELSVKLGLTDRQLQMWFCHRRLKDRKVTPVKNLTQDVDERVPGGGVGVGYEVGRGGEMRNEGGPGSVSGSGSGSSPFEPRKVVARAAAAVSRIGADMPMVHRYYEPPPQSVSELRAIAFVEAQLGGPVREDGPVLGMEFDPLPPGAFDAPIANTGQQIQVGRAYDDNMYDRRETKPIKTPTLVPDVEPFYLPGSSGGKRKLTSGVVHIVHPQVSVRAPHEYQFLPEQPSAKSEGYKRVDPTHYYNSGTDAPSHRAPIFSGMVPYHQAKEHVTVGCAVQGQVPSVSVMSHQGREVHLSSSAPGEYGSPHRFPFTDIGVDSQVGVHPIAGIENPFLPSDRLGSHEEEALRIEKKRKCEEARIAREAEAHEKRIRKELEKQDIIRRKREEQMRREMERHDRERRKEEERLMRERQREEERFQREQQRELERRERFLQKETLRAEKMRQKEELRKEKEAARLKAANERATARRIAKESTELIEDERLELMELAVSKKGLPSMLSLDSETLQNLDLLRDMLSTFPPKSMQLKKPFRVQPWADSDENVGNLLMVWRFLITFADVLELWPFTLDEFVQAMHDYEPRLLCEIHVALLRSIIKDIEDVARTPFIGLGATQNSGANPGGGHPKIVEGAYAWGFDIRCWQRHLNPMTWPEILRQFALSAGFGPQLKKRSLERAYVRDDNEGHDSVDIVSTLRNGAAAENALAVMQEKGFSQPRKSRHRLTPGTVKFAAFHILSLEGSKGLTILEVVEKIQKSGLRDLTTSKTPEASVSAALSRDGKLFERTAPSTYCVKAAFRKDPVDAEALLSAARDKIQIFANGFSDSEADKDTEDADDIERYLDSECDVAEDPEDVDIGVVANSVEGVLLSNEATASKSLECSVNRSKDAILSSIQQNGFIGDGKGLSSFHMEDKNGVNGKSVNCNVSTNPDQEDTEIDESNSGEPWVQGLMEGEYSDLTVEERLSALVALVGVAIEGNSIRIILEERLEAANALKKQMWSEAQLDKRRIKEEYVTKFHYPSYTGIKADLSLTSSVVDENQKPYVFNNKNNETSLIPSVKQESALDLHNVQNNFSNLPTERTLTGHDFSAGPDSLAQHHGFAAEKSRAQLKDYIGHKAEEMYVYRSLPLGQDRRHNRYWQFVTSASRNDPGSSRIFLESQGGCWRLIDSEEGFDTLVASLDTRGIRESHLHSMLQKIETPFKEAVRGLLNHTSSADPGRVTTKSGVSEMTFSPACSTGKESPSSTLCDASVDTQVQSSSFKIELGRTQSEKKSAMKRYQDFQKWMWKQCCNPSILCAKKFGKKRSTVLLTACDLCHDSYLSDNHHCSVCHMTFGSFHNLDFTSHSKQCEKQKKLQPESVYDGSNSSQPLRIRLLKLQLALIEVFVPDEGLQPLWTDNYRKSWGLKLQNSSSAEELLLFLTILEGAIKRDYLSSSFETTKELLGSSMSEGYAVGSFYNAIPGAVPVLPWVPLTTSAVALRLMELDASISYMSQQKVESHKDEGASEFIKLPSTYTVIKNTQETVQHEFPSQTGYSQEENRINLRVELDNFSRGQGVRGRGRGHNCNRGGRKLKKPGTGLRAEFEKENAGRMGRNNRARGRGSKRGRRTIKIRRKPAEKIVDQETALGQFGVTSVFEQNTTLESPSSHHKVDWNEEIRGVHAEDDNVSNSAEEMDFDDHGQVRYEYGNLRTSYGGMYHHKAEDFMVSEEDEVEVDSEEDDVEDYVNMDLYRGQMGSEYGEGDKDEGNAEGNDEDVDSASSDYSV